MVVAELNNSYTMSGYDLITSIHKKFRILISPGTTYSLLYALERKGLTKGILNRRKRMYKLTDKGKETINIILNAKEEIKKLMITLL